MHESRWDFKMTYYITCKLNLGILKYGLLHSNSKSYLLYNLKQRMESVLLYVECKIGKNSINNFGVNVLNFTVVML
jgi:hypothetical protein